MILNFVGRKGLLIHVAPPSAFLHTPDEGLVGLDHGLVLQLGVTGGK